MARVFIAIALLTASVNSENSTLTQGGDASDTCGAMGFGPWSQALEDWATSAHSDRHGRIMALPATKGYYVTERIDVPYLSPPPPLHSPYQQTSSNYGHGPSNQGQYYSNPGYIPPNQSQMSPSQGHIPLNQGHMPSKGPKAPGKAPAHGKAPAPGHREWDGAPPGVGKIVNRPPARDQPKPGYPVDRVDEPPRKHVSETDLFLLSAIEKLVARADRMDERLRAVELQLRRAAPAAEPCPSPFVRVGEACYSWGLAALDWKRAAQECRARGAALVELLTRDQRRALLANLHTVDKLKDFDYWTGGLNPGLLWIWSHSARPLALDDASAKNQTGASVPGAGRCLALAWEPARRTHVYRGRDCAHELRYVCERHEAPRTRDVSANAPSTRDVSANAPSTRDVSANAPSTRDVSANAPSTRDVSANAPSTRDVSTNAPSTGEAGPAEPSTREAGSSAPAERQ